MAINQQTCPSPNLGGGLLNLILMIYKFSFFCMLFFALSCSTCGPIVGVEKCNKDYLFSIPVTLIPNKDTLHIGDTIHIDIDFFADMIDLNSWDTIDMSMFPFNSEIVLAKIDENPSHSADNMVDYSPITGDLNIISLTGGGKAVQIVYDKDNSKIRFACDLILNEKGVFALVYESYFLDEFHGKLQSMCETKSVDINYRLNSGMIVNENNYYLLKQSLDPKISNLSKEIFDKYGGFAFVVID